MSDEILLIKNEDGTFSTYNDTYDLVIHCESREEREEVIERLKATNWIPVDEKLPDPDKYILVSFENFPIPMIGIYTADDDDGGTFRISGKDDSFLEHGLHVDAWMELPKRYREEDQMGRCKLECPDGETQCCICCTKQDSCQCRCSDMDIYEEAEECEDYETD